MEVMMGAEENKAAFRRTYEEIFNQGSFAAADELIAPDYVDHEEHPGNVPGPDAVRTVAAMLRTAFPDLHFTIEELITEGDLVAGRLTMRGTHDGPLMGLPATGRQVQQAHMHFVRFRDGKAVEHWGVRDDVGLMRQLGLMPDPREKGGPTA
jgi:steroid delta-isomerase-like uncharacterized protein